MLRLILQAKIFSSMAAGQVGKCMSDHPSVLVVGCGSIGERHFRCFRNTGRARVGACDTNPALRAHIRAQYDDEPVWESLDAALESSVWDAIVICTPANSHVPIAQRALAHGSAVLIEKPLSIGLDGVDALVTQAGTSRKPVVVAYVYHSMPAMVQARAFLLAGSLGKPLQVTVCAGQHFPEFRPAYRDIYYNNHATGGGAIQDALTHLVNAVEWIIGPATSVFCQAAHMALEGVAVEDTVSVTARHGETIVSYSLNQFQIPNETTVAIHCEHGSVKLEAHEQRWGVYRKGDKAWEWHSAKVTHRDDLFTAQANSFLDAMEGKPHNLCSLEEAFRTLKFNLAALDSARSGKVIRIS